MAGRDRTVGLSFEAVAAGAGGYTAQGWRYATEDEVCRFMHRNVLPEWVAETGCAPIATGDFSEEARARGLAVLDRLGVTWSEYHEEDQVHFFALFGIYDDGDPEDGVGFGRIGTGVTDDPDGAWSTNCQVQRDVFSPASPPGDRFGSFLVRAAPQAVPGLSAGGCAAAAVVMLAAVRRRLRRT